ncbi:unnamed protein product, partial [Rotaria magnacalcarata]
LDFSSANQHVEELLHKFEQRKLQAQDYFDNVIYSHAGELCEELFVTPTIPRHAVSSYRKQNTPVPNPEIFYCDRVYLPFLDELINNISGRLSSLK